MSNEQTHFVADLRHPTTDFSEGQWSQWSSLPIIFL